MIAACKTELDNVLGTIKSLKLPQKERKTAAELLDKEWAAELIDEIKPLWEIYVSFDDAKIETLRELIFTIGEKCGLLVSQLESFDLEAALERLTK